MAAYSRSARVYDALCRKKDYGRAARRLLQVLRRVAPCAQDLLDVACGTGRHLEHLCGRFRVEGLDVSRHMLAIARQRCPGARLHRGTLVDFDLRRQFDVITCLFSSIGHAKTLAGLRKAVRCMARHLRPGGVLVVEPWITPEHFVTGRIVFDCVDDADLKVARMYITERRGAVSIFDSHYVVATADGVEHFRERQELGLFADEQYRAAFHDAGLAVIATKPDLFGYGLYVCCRANDVRRRDSARRRMPEPLAGTVD